jgi:secondary thiamine-phosphate synthase enzyme
MAVHSSFLRLSTTGDGQMLDLTDGVARVVLSAGVSDGVTTVFAVGATVAVTTIEFEPGAIADFAALLERLVPARGAYEHNRLNHDTNAHAHLRAALIGPSESIPVVGGRLALGTWQQVVLLDFDDRPRERTVQVHVVS